MHYHDVSPEDPHTMKSFCNDCLGPVKRVYLVRPGLPVEFVWTHGSW